MMGAGGSEATQGLAVRGAGLPSGANQILGAKVQMCANFLVDVTTDINGVPRSKAKESPDACANHDADCGEADSSAVSVFA